MITPEVSRSSRCTSSSGSPGRSARRDSISPWLMPLPPWVARPLGLFTASRALSSNTMLAASRSSRPFGGGRTSPGSFSFTGGILTSSPPARRLSALARLPLMRTWPLRTSL